MIEKLKENLDSNKIFVLGEVTTNAEIDQKYKWLSKHYPNIKRENLFFICSTLLKPEVIIGCCKYYNIDIKQTLFFLALDFYLTYNINPFKKNSQKIWLIRY